MRELLIGGSPFTILLEIVLSVRVYERTRMQHTLNVALRELHSGAPSKWVIFAVRQCFAMYCALRRAAVPLAAHRTTAILSHLNRWRVKKTMGQSTKKKCLVPKNN